MPFEIVKSGTHIDFIGRRRLAGAISALMLLASLAAVPIQGIRLGIDFAGGTEIQVRFPDGTPVDEGVLRGLVGQLEDVANLSVVRYGEAEQNEFLIKFRGSDGEEAAPADVAPPEAEAVPEGEEAEVAVAEAPAATPPAPESEDPGGLEAGANDVVIALDEVLERALGEHSIERVEFVGPRVGAELREDGLRALLFASLVILAYVAFRFSSRFAPGAIFAVIHDLLITAGVFVILGLEFDLRVLAAMLATLGYSLNDTIIIYDRIRENMELRTKADLPDVLNESVNQTLSRTVLTSGTTLVALLALFFLGGEVIRPFAFAMTIGVVVGTYSSVFIAAPTLLLLERRFGGLVSASR